LEQGKSQTFKKVERITSKKVIDSLFEAGNPSLTVFPFRVVYMTVPKNDVPVSILVSVSKRRFHDAVDRNRMKRFTREAYRKQKQILWDKLHDSNRSLDVAFIFIGSKLCSYQMIYKSVNKVLNRLVEEL